MYAAVIFIICIFPTYLCLSQEVPLKVNKNQHNDNNYPLINNLQSQLDEMMQDSAGWLDSIGQETSSRDKASANGYLKLAWQPRRADLDKTDIKFKVNLNLPNWSKRLAFIVDNDDEDEIKVDYESDPLATHPQDQSFNVAFQYLKGVNKYLKIKNRIGSSRKQVYIRSELKFKWQKDNTLVTLFPRIDYFNKDGWSPGIKASVNYSLRKSMISISASSQKLESEQRARKKAALNYITFLEGNQLLVASLLATRNNKNNITRDSYLTSVRYRRLIYKHWLYIELEPFVEFNETLNYQREAGMLISALSYYGK